MPDEGSCKLVCKYSRTTTDVDWITNEAQNKRPRNAAPFEIQHGARSPGLPG
ncbi:GD14753 [Drosophila simulans]|uniref:GD14753 n=1 Tax=Drosophila simulans TaxID=7240 RepID=B4QPT3_DROSI|nr:GD14753 [Drosophila simulans]